MKKILITGAAGYIGSALTRSLIRDPNNYLILVDKGMYGYEGYEAIKGYYKGDRRCFHNVSVTSFLQSYMPQYEGIDVVVHLSGLSNDPLADFDVNANHELNYKDTVKLVDECIKRKIPRFLYASSASVYGMTDDAIVNESSRLNPTSHYAHSKYESEKYIDHHGFVCSDFRPVIFRKATVMGSSPRMRFDLVVNTMIMNALRFKEIRLTGGGENWRPLIHINDVIQAYTMFINMHDEKYLRCSNNTYNLVHKNYRISELGLWMGHLFGDSVKVKPDYSSEKDVRSYRMSGNKIKMACGFEAELGVSYTFNEIDTWITTNKPNFEDPIFYNIRWIKACERAANIMKIKFDLIT